MKTTELKVARIGNSRGVRLPVATLRRYRIGEAVIMEERSEGIMLRPPGPSVEKLSWEATAREMAAPGENWDEWDAAAADGLDDIPWDAVETPRVAERKARYQSPSLRPSGGKK
jgi:antitoxin component of MazEF toxin-antitoxin module